MVFFHHLVIDLKFLFPFELIIISLFIIINKKYLLIKNSPINKTFTSCFLLLAFVNMLSAFNGYLNVNVLDFEANIAVSVIYVLMLIYFYYGKIMAFTIKDKVILNFMIVSLGITFGVVLLESFFMEVKLALVQFYQINSNTDLEAINYRSVGPFKNPNNLAVMTSFFLSVISVQEKKLYKKIFFFSMGGFVILQTGSRTGFVIFLILLFYSLLFVEARKSQRFKVVFFLFIILGYLSFSDFFQDFGQSRVAETKVDSAFDTRISAYWLDTFELIYEYPIIGTGLIHSEKGTADNFYLSVVKANGILGLLLFLLPFIMAGYSLIKHKKMKDNERTILALLFVFLLSSMSGDFFYAPPYYPFLFCIFGYYLNIELFDKRTSGRKGVKPRNNFSATT